MNLTDSSVLLGAAGEHLVLSELIKRGVIAAKAPEGAPNMDIVVTDVSGERLAAVQVKSRRDKGSDKGWHMKAKHDKLHAERMYYVFVDFGKTADDLPQFFVVPSKVIADACRVSHAIWLRAPGKGGMVHKDSDMRRFKPRYHNEFEGMTAADRRFFKCHAEGWLEQYRNAWHLLV